MSKNILIVDDSPITQKQLSKIISEGGYSILEIADSGTKAIEVFTSKKSSIDLITLDITMPGMDGIDVLKHIMSVSPDTKVVMISAVGKDSTIKECMMLGARQFITKPFIKQKVLEILKIVIG